MAGKILMGQKELQRSHVLKKVQCGEMKKTEAAKQLQISYRQLQRIYARYLEEGDAGLPHRNQGRAANNRIQAEIQERALKAYRERYFDFGPTLAAEHLLRSEKIRVSEETLRQWLLGAGLWQRKRRGNPYRSRRERRACFGELVQFDGSRHDWFEGRRGKCCLMNMVDDATGMSFSMLFEEETTEAAMRVLWGWIQRYGIPQALYCDRKNAFVSNREPSVEEQLAGIEPKSHFERACEKLGIEVIRAYSPQAKGRVERNHAVYQDRFIKELRLAGVGTIEEANKFLEEKYLPVVNGKFARVPACLEDGHIPLGRVDLGEILCFEEQRVVSRDFVIGFKRRLFQILPKSRPRPHPGEKVTVRVRLDGSLDVYFKSTKLSCKEIPIEMKKEEARIFKNNLPIQDISALGRHTTF